MNTPLYSVSISIVSGVRVNFTHLVEFFCARRLLERRPSNGVLAEFSFATSHGHWMQIVLV